MQSLLTDRRVLLPVVLTAAAIAVGSLLIIVLSDDASGGSPDAASTSQSTARGPDDQRAVRAQRDRRRRDRAGPRRLARIPSRTGFVRRGRTDAGRARVAGDHAHRHTV